MDHLVSELRVGLDEAAGAETPVRAGLIKIACEAELQRTPQVALDAAMAAAVETGCAVEVHTEKGAEAEKILGHFRDHGVTPDRMTLCHMDKRPDPGLHFELAKGGALLEYDTFFRPQYDPERNQWPLVNTMAVHGLCDRVALASDLALSVLWKSMGGGPGMASFPKDIRARLRKTGLDPASIELLMGKNIAQRRAMPGPEARSQG
jgi:phosphotriesterase-related protein